MEFLELAKTRYSVRSYSDAPLEKEKLEKILEAGLCAPTAKNGQPFRIYVIFSEDGLKTVRGLTRCDYGAPVVLLFAYDTEEEWQNALNPAYYSGQQDVSIVATHVMLEAWELGIGSCWVNMFDPDETAKAFQLPATEKPVLLMPIGYPAEGAEPSPRHFSSRSTAEVVRYL